MVMIQLLLPRTGHQGRSLEAEFLETRRELIAAFGGLTAYQRSPALGAWTNPDGTVERDEVVMVEVVTKEFDRDWWRGYREQLEARFKQQELHVRALPIEVP
jgi:hypothetical protein